jgi:SpoVK/Ycf46/Vps4 family AAA+-type ATPase
LKNDDTRATVNLISARDLLLQASSSTCDVNALKQIMISSIKKQDDISSSTQRINQRQIFVIDDLDVLLDEEDAGNNDSSSATSISKLSHERRIALQAVLEVIDEMVQPRRNNSMFDINSIAHDDNDVNLIPLILGVYCSESFNAPPILNRVGRFEKVLTMAPPSELQRQSIFISMLDQLPILKHGMKSGTNEDSRDKTKLIELWSTALARTTAGCVASDLKRICIDATTISGARSTKVNSNDDGDILLFSITEEEDKEIEVSWEDLKEATRSCIPSQLAQLDVTIPRDAMDQDNFDILSFVDTRGTKEWFQKCWPKFGGYHDMKADLYRTVFRPWCRRQHLSNKWDRRRMSQLEKEVPPPTGILFHGASGTGKTFAADCLARSLGLNIIKVSSTFDIRYVPDLYSLSGLYRTCCHYDIGSCIRCVG